MNLQFLFKYNYDATSVIDHVRVYTTKPFVIYSKKSLWTKFDLFENLILIGSYALFILNENSLIRLSEQIDQDIFHIINI